MVARGFAHPITHGRAGGAGAAMIIPIVFSPCKTPYFTYSVDVGVNSGVSVAVGSAVGVTVGVMVGATVGVIVGVVVDLGVEVGIRSSQLSVVWHFEHCPR